MYVQRNDSFLYTCKEAFFLGIHPLRSESQTSEGYQALVSIFKGIPDSKKVELFLDYLGEEKYYCNLWAAHLMLQFSKLNPELQRKCREVLQSVSAQVI